MSLVASNQDFALREFLSARADDAQMRMQMNKSIARDGYVQLKDLESDIENKTSLIATDVYLTSCGIQTDLITKGMILAGNTEKDTEVKQKLNTKYT